MAAVTICSYFGAQQNKVWDCFHCFPIGKDSEAGRDWGQEEKGMTGDEMAGWHHQLHGREFEWTPGVGDGQGGLACCNSWGWEESDMTEQLNWTEDMETMCLWVDKKFVVSIYNKMLFTYKNKEILSFAKAWTTLEGIMLREKIRDIYWLTNWYFYVSKCKSLIQNYFIK